MSPESLVTIVAMLMKWQREQIGRNIFRITGVVTRISLGT